MEMWSFHAPSVQCFNCASNWIRSVRTRCAHACVMVRSLCTEVPGVSRCLAAPCFICHIRKQSFKPDSPQHHSFPFENAKKAARKEEAVEKRKAEREREHASQQHVYLQGKRKPPGPESPPRRQSEVRGLESFYSEAPIQSHTVLYSSLWVFPYPKPISKCFRPARSSLPLSLACLTLPLVSWWGQMSRLTQRLRRLTW